MSSRFVLLAVGVLAVWLAATSRGRTVFLALAGLDDELIDNLGGSGSGTGKATGTPYAGPDSSQSSGAIQPTGITTGTSGKVYYL